MSQPPRRVIVGISGASGAVYGARLLQALQDMPNVESHLVVSDAGWRNLRHELDMDRASVEALLARLSKERLDTAVEIARLPLEIRGFGHVKAWSMKKAAEKRTALLAPAKSGHQGGAQVA